MADPTTTPPPDGEMITAISLLDSARRAGHAAWFERRMYEVVGRWAADGVEPSATVAFAVQTQRHADRAAEWFTRLPELRELPPDELVGSSGEAVEAVVDRLAVLDGSAHRAAGLVVVLTALTDAYRCIGTGLSPIADAPTMRTVARVLAELPGEVAAVAAVADPPSAETGLSALGVALAEAGPLFGAVRFLTAR